MSRRIRVLVGKPGLDGHDRGAKVVAAALRDAGMEVIYTGLHQTPEQIVEAAVQEDVDVVALSILSGAHMTLFPEVMEQMRGRGIGDRLLTGGGIIPPEDMDSLAGMGVGRLFGPGSSTRDIAIYIHATLSEREGGESLAPLADPPALSAAEMVTPSEVAHHRPSPAAPRKAGAKPAAAKGGARRKAALKSRKAAAKPRKAAKSRASARRKSAARSRRGR